MLCTKIVLNVRNNFCSQHVLPRFELLSRLGIFMYVLWTCNSMNNLSSYCGLVYAKIRASDKDLPVICEILSRKKKWASIISDFVSVANLTQSNWRRKIRHCKPAHIAKLLNTVENNANVGTWKTLTRISAFGVLRNIKTWLNKPKISWKIMDMI